MNAPYSIHNFFLFRSKLTEIYKSIIIPKQGSISGLVQKGIFIFVVGFVVVVVVMAMLVIVGAFGDGLCFRC